MRLLRYIILVFFLNPVLLYSKGADTIQFPIRFINDVSADAGEELNEIISKVKRATVIQFESGNYYFSSPLILKSNIRIAGAFGDATKFVFDLNGKRDLIEIKGSRSKAKIKIEKTVNAGDCELQIGDTQKFEVGMMVRIFKSESIIELSDWANQSIGQMMEVVQVNDSSVKFKKPIRLEYTLSEVPMLEIIEPIENVSFSNLIIERKDQTDYQTSNFNLSCARNCVLENIVSVMTNFAHVNVDYSKGIRIEKFDTYNSFSHGNGGKGYGITLQYSSTECLIQDCVFRKMRHGVVIQSGANGNIVRGNYALEGFWEEVRLPKFSAGDIVLHGNYPYQNIIEGNVCNQIVIDKSHGLNGFTTLLKNRLLKYGIFVQSKSVEGVLIQQNDLVKSKCLEGKIRGRKMNLDLNCNRRNSKLYKANADKGFECKPMADNTKHIYSLGYPCDFSNYYNAAIFRYKSSLISTFN